MVNFLNFGLEGVLPFNSAKNGWRIQVLFTQELVRVTHMRREQANHDSERMYISQLCLCEGVHTSM